MQDKIRPQLWNVIENFNTDIAEAARDGLTAQETIAIIGSISETGLKTITPADRLRFWQVIVDVMARKFDEGEL